MQEKRAVLAKRVALFYCLLKASIIQCCVFRYLAIRAIRVAHRHEDLWEELLGLLLCVLLLRYTSGCIWGAPQITRITTHHRNPRLNPQLNYSLMLHSYETNTLKISGRCWILLMIKHERKMRGVRRDTGETIQDISEEADTCVAGNRTNTPSLIRNESGKPAECLVVKPLLHEAARAAPVEHSSHPRKGLMHRENLTLP